MCLTTNIINRLIQEQLLFKICLYEILIKRKDQVAEGLAPLGFSDLLSFPEMKPIFVGGVKTLTLEELISHLILIAPDSSSGEVTYSYLQQYIMDLDETGRYQIATFFPGTPMHSKG